MKHFGEPRIDSSSLKSFDEIFKSQKDKDNALERIAFDGQDDASRVVNEELIDLCTGKFASQHVPSDGNCKLYCYLAKYCMIFLCTARRCV